jgi:hypothetical protein
MSFVKIIVKQKDEKQTIPKCEKKSTNLTEIKKKTNTKLRSSKFRNMIMRRKSQKLKYCQWY